MVRPPPQACSFKKFFKRIQAEYFLILGESSETSDENSVVRLHRLKKQKLTRLVKKATTGSLYKAQNSLWLLVAVEFFFFDS